LVFRRALALIALLTSAALFGFFYAWICSTMWGLATLPPDIAIQAMNAMNANVQNATFAWSFFGAGLLLFATGLLNLRSGGVWFLIAAFIVWFGGNGITFIFHIPLNTNLALVAIPTPDATAIWQSYTSEWEFWNITRCVFCGIGVLLAGIGLIAIGAANRVETAA